MKMEGTYVAWKLESCQAAEKSDVVGIYLGQPLEN